MPHARVSQSQHFVGVPLQTAVPLHDPNRSLWTAVEQTGSMGQTAGGTTDFASQLGFHRSAHQQGLSLSLSPQQQHPFRSLQMESPVGLLSARAAADNIRDSGASSSSITTGISGFISGSKYLKAAQELLDEVVNVENTVEEEVANKERGKMKKESMSTYGGGAAGDTTIIGGENRAAELTTAQRQELQMKKAKLMTMLEEVEQRDRQYNQQMEVMVASFEQAAGVGAAKSYTHLALKTISRQFRCLKVAIASQIKAAGRSLGEEAHGLLLGGSSSNSSRLLKFVNQNHHHHQLQQHFGMMQPNAWRPQRGLPERAVSVLRAWLFEHFLHPYPKDSDKVMLAKQTGLTRSQVSNWFINARVRLWKPMVEEMYTEEMKGQDQHGKDQNATKRNNEANNKESSSCLEKASITSKDSHTLKQQQQQQPPQQGAFSFINIENNLSGGEIQNGKKPRNGINSSPSSIVSADMEYTVDRQGLSAPENYPDLLAAANAANGFGGFSMGDFGRFNPENLAPGFHPNNGSVSLTLGLPPSENQQNYLSTHQDMDLGRRLDMGAEWE